MTPRRHSVTTSRQGPSPQVACDAEAVARLKPLSVNAREIVAIDRLLKEHGRPAISELAPWFPDYLMPQGGTPREKEPPARGEFD